MRYQILVGILLLTNICAVAQRRVQYYTDYIEKYRDEAVRQMNRYGIPASITLAQGLLESGAGRSRLTKQSNNHFGIKCGNDWRGRRTYHDDDARGECFRVYKDARESYEDHSRFLAGKKRYAALFTLKRTDYKGWAKGLKKAGYATNPAYAQRLIELIELYGLDRYDRGGKVGGQPIYPHEPFMANGLLYIVARDGDTWEELKQEFGISERKLRKWNDLYKGYRLKAGDIIYLEKKHRCAKKPYYTHTVQHGESMYMISQRYGVRLERLYKMNELSPEETLSVGQILRVR